MARMAIITIMNGMKSGPINYHIVISRIVHISSLTHGMRTISNILERKHDMIIMMNYPSIIISTLLD